MFTLDYYNRILGISAIYKQFKVGNIKIKVVRIKFTERKVVTSTLEFFI